MNSLAEAKAQDNEAEANAISRSAAPIAAEPQTPASSTATTSDTNGTPGVRSGQLLATAAKASGPAAARSISSSAGASPAGKCDNACCLAAGVVGGAVSGALNAGAGCCGGGGIFDRLCATGCGISEIRRATEELYCGIPKVVGCRAETLALLRTLSQAVRLISAAEVTPCGFPNAAGLVPGCSPAVSNAAALEEAYLCGCREGKKDGASSGLKKSSSREARKSARKFSTRQPKRESGNRSRRSLYEDEEEDADLDDSARCCGYCGGGLDSGCGCGGVSSSSSFCSFSSLLFLAVSHERTSFESLSSQQRRAAVTTSRCATQVTTAGISTSAPTLVRLVSI